MDRRPPLAVSPRRLRPRPHRVPRPPLAPASSVSVQTPPGSMKKAAAPMRASVCAIPSPVRFNPSPMRASVSAFPSPVRYEPSPMRASISALPSPVHADPSPMCARRVKIDLTAAGSWSPAKAAAEKENFVPAAAPSTLPAAKAGIEEENFLPPGADAHNELVALNLAAIAAGTPAGGPLFVRGRNYDVYTARRNERLKRKQGFPYYSAEESSSAATIDPDAVAEDPCVAVELSKRRVAKKAYTASGAESVRRSMPAVDFAAGRGGGLGPRSSLRTSKEMKKASAASSAVSVAIKERRVNPRSSARRF